VSRAPDTSKPFPMGDYPALGRNVYVRYLGYRAPRAGEYYLSGAIVEVWRAPNDLEQAFHVVRPTHYARRVSAWVQGEAFPSYRLNQWTCPNCERSNRAGADCDCGVYAPCEV